MCYMSHQVRTQFYRMDAQDEVEQDKVEQDLNDAFTDYTIDEIVQAYSQLMSVDNSLIPAFSEEDWWPDHFDFEHFYHAKAKFEYEYMKKYVLPEFTEKKNVVSCILDTYVAYGLSDESCSENLVRLKEVLKKNHSENKSGLVEDRRGTDKKLPLASEFKEGDHAKD